MSKSPHNSITDTSLFSVSHEMSKMTLRSGYIANQTLSALSLTHSKADR